LCEKLLSLNIFLTNYSTTTSYQSSKQGETPIRVADNQLERLLLAFQYHLLHHYILMRNEKELHELVERFHWKLSSQRKAFSSRSSIYHQGKPSRDVIIMKVSLNYATLCFMNCVTPDLVDVKQTTALLKARNVHEKET